MKYFLRDMLSFLTNRLFIMFCIVLVLFYVFSAQLYELQIIKGEEYLNNLNASTSKPSTIPAVRGTIYDRYGRPLAVNTPTYSVKIDPSIKVEDFTWTMYNLLQLLEKNDEKIIVIDSFPISRDEPYTYTFGSERAEQNWKRDMNVDQKFDAEQAFDYLRGEKRFNLPEDISNDTARSLLALCSSVYMERYNYNLITVAQNVKMETIAAIEEQYEKYQSVYVDVEYMREYPAGQYLSHILGYLRGISQEELDIFKDYGYKYNDIIGKTGIERAFELQLRGTDGKRMIEVQNNIGRRVTTSIIQEPLPGDKIFLTLDSRLQKNAYEILERMLTQILINKLSGTFSRQEPITVRDLLSSMILSNAISIKKIVNADEETYMHSAKSYILGRTPENQLKTEDDLNAAKEVLAEGVSTGAFSATNVVLILLEQEIITGDEKYIEDIKRASNNTLRQMLIEKIKINEITPQMVNLEPASGSVAVVDVNDGSVLAAVTYPTYDNNEFANNFNNEYYNKLNNDPTRPLINRVFSEPRAPGSTFKMITALTCLTKGVITPSKTIFDEFTFTKAGVPYAKCLSHHNNVNLISALEVSCNYYFYDAAYMMGNAKEGTTLESINALNEFMRAFGLDDRTGVEIYELYDSSAYPEGVSKISSPEYMKYLYSVRYGSDATARWVDGETIRTAIGQSYNRYTPATMAKYFATLATKGVRYQMHLLDKAESSSGEITMKFEPVVEHVLDVRDEYWQAVYDGMLAVTQGSRGTARGAFAGFEMKVAGKTGTAQEDEKRNEHTQFGCFAPYDNPQIAVYVVIPYGDNQTTSAPAAQVARQVIEEYFALKSEPETQVYNTLAE